MHSEGNYKQGEKTAFRMGENNSKRSHEQNEKTAYRLRENICKWCYQQRIYFQNIQTAYTANIRGRGEGKKT